MQGLPVPLVDWVRDRAENCERIAATKTGADREGWLQDARYFRAVLTALGLLADCTIDAILAKH